MIFYLSTLFRKLFGEFPASYLRPLSLICPVCSRHFTTTNILGMSRLKAGPFLLHRSTFARLGYLNGHLWAYTFLTIGVEPFRGGGSARE